mmetsp:Transcript_2918/g.7844  ORF Transcript_2918/g.7844 Transcript_2918/m.7844 type:complete len:207 (+) Transcript_2918:717-1337(+)
MFGEVHPHLTKILYEPRQEVEAGFPARAPAVQLPLKSSQVEPEGGVALRPPAPPLHHQAGGGLEGQPGVPHQPGQHQERRPAQAHLAVDQDVQAVLAPPAQRRDPHGHGLAGVGDQLVHELHVQVLDPPGLEAVGNPAGTSREVHDSFDLEGVEYGPIHSRKPGSKEDMVLDVEHLLLRIVRLLPARRCQRRIQDRLPGQVRIHGP